MVLAVPGAAGARPDAASSGGRPAIELLSRSSATTAISALGADLPAVAQANGLTTSELTRAPGDRQAPWRGPRWTPLLRRFESSPRRLRAARSPARLRHQPPLRPWRTPSSSTAVRAPNGSSTWTSTATRSPARPGTYYKTTNGGRDIICPPWDIDGQPSVFGDTERTRIQQVWQRVSEDYAPFDVDVTTEYTGEAALTRSSTADEYYGMRVLISPISSYFGSYGGDRLHRRVRRGGRLLQAGLGLPREARERREVHRRGGVARERSHARSLSRRHDRQAPSTTPGHGSGETGWAPIMGNGYYKNLTQWSKGEYTGANRQRTIWPSSQATGSAIGPTTTATPQRRPHRSRPAPRPASPE